MTPEAQKIAISEACGKRYHKPTPEEIASGSYYQYEPDYLNDLNAIHEAEKVLTLDLLRRMTIELHDVMVRHPELDWIPVHHATAAQRAEAFLKTLGLWKD
jgi:hypothetical protein